MMSRIIARLWKALADFPHLYLGIVLAIEASAASLICWKGYLEPSLIQFQLGIEEILATRHIYSTFLPIGYPALLGWAEVFGLSHGTRGMHAAVFAIQILIILLIVLAIRAILMQSGSARFATTAALLIGLYPQFISGVKKINDANLTLLTLLLIVLALLKLRQTATVWHAAGGGAALACAVLVRPNLVLMAALVFWSVYGPKRAEPAKTLLAAGLAAVIVYAGITGFVHGRPFFPENGPYNLYAGFNPYSEEKLRGELNAENAIVPAMADMGIHTHLNWQRQSDIPGIDDPRDLKYAPFYRAQTEAFIRDNPATSVRLSIIKLATLMRQNYSNKDHESAHFHEYAILLKRIVLIVIPCWGGLLIYSRWKHWQIGNGLIIWLVVLYFIPFIVINADPRFRITIEGIVLTDIARMLYAIHVRKNRSEELGTPVIYNRNA